MTQEYPLVVDQALRNAIHEHKTRSGRPRLGWDESQLREVFPRAVERCLTGSGAVRLLLLDNADRFDLESLEHLLTILSSSIGYLVPQSGRNNLLGLVKDEGLNYSLPTSRGHRTNAGIAFHCDRSDLVILLYVRPAKNGGRISLVSFQDVYDALAQEKSPHLGELLKPFPFDLRDDRIDCSQTWCMHPILWISAKGVRGHYIRRFITDSARHADCPPLSERQIKALDRLDSVLEELRPARTYSPASGELLLINSYKVMHAREPYVDDPGGPGRLALRSWVSPFDSEPLPEFMLPISGAVEAGSYRGGVGSGEKYLSLIGKKNISYKDTLSV